MTDENLIETNEIGESPTESMPESAKKNKSAWRWLWRSLLALLLILLVLIGSVVVAAHSERGTRALFKVANKVTGGMVQAQWVSGSLARGGSAETLTVHLKTVHIDIYDLSGQWRWGFLPIHWRVQQIAARRLDLSLFPSDKPSEPIQKIHMPFTMTVDDLRVHDFNLIRGVQTTVMKDIAGSLRTDKVQHHIRLDNMMQGVAQYSGLWDVNGNRPFNMQGQFDVGVQDEGSQYNAQLKLAGDLKHLNLDIVAQGEHEGNTSGKSLDGQGHLEVQLIEGWYIHKGQINFTRVNPKLFWSSLPRADLDITLSATPQEVNDAKARKPMQELTRRSSLPQEVNDAKARKPVEGNWTLTNRQPLPLSELGVPVNTGKGQFTLTDEKQTLHDMQLALMGGGQMTGAGQFVNRQGEIDVQVQDYNLKTIHPKLLTTALDGTLKLFINPTEQRYEGTLAQSGAVNMRIDAGVLMSNGLIDIQTAKISGLGDAFANFVGKIKMSEHMPIEGKLQVQQFNLKDLGAFPNSQLMGEFAVDGDLRPAVKLNFKGDLQPSRWENANAHGKVDVTYLAPDRVDVRNLDVTIGNNRFVAQGALGKAGDRLKFNINAPTLEQLQFGFAGSLVAQGDLTGAITAPRGSIDAQGSRLAFFGNTIANLKLNGQWDAGENGALNADVLLNDYAVGPVNLKQLQASVKGTQKAHQFNTSFAGAVHILDANDTRKAVQWILDGQAAGSGGVTDKGWRGTLTQLHNVGQPNIQMQQPAQIAFEDKEFSIDKLMANVQDAQLNVQHFAIQGARINSQGSVTNLVASRWLSWLAMKLPFYPSDDFAMRGQWDIGMGAQPSGGFSFERERGNIALDERRRNIIELSDMNLQGRISGTQMVLTGLLAGANIGENRIGGNVGLVNSSAGWVISGLSPLNLNVAAKLNQLKQFNRLLGVNIRIDGQAQADLILKGTLANWQPEGVVTAQNLSFYHVDEGIRLSDGVARLRVEPSQVVFDEFTAKGIEGTVSVKGTVGWGAQKQGVNATLVMDKLRPFARPDREVVLSGSTQLGFDGVNLFSIQGDVMVDRALIDLPPTFAPSLAADVHFVKPPVPTVSTEPAANHAVSLAPKTPAQHSEAIGTTQSITSIEKTEPNLASDVHVRAAAPAHDSSQVLAKPVTEAVTKNTTAHTKSAVVTPKVKPRVSAPVYAAVEKPRNTLNYATQMDLNVDLGKNFHFKGQGADVFMTGKLRMRSTPENPEIRTNGTVNIARGTYLFYGQTLTVQRGLVTFNGALDDPSLNITALRTINSTEVGVDVGGTLSDTRVRLTSNPDMADEDKLAWLLFGRSTSELGSNDIGAIAGAMSVLLNSDKGRKLTERFGIDSIGVGSAGTKEDGSTGTSVNVGRQFSDRFGVAYEQGIDTVSSILRITWSLSRSWQVILRGGTASGVDIQYRKRFDKIRWK